LTNEALPRVPEALMKLKTIGTQFDIANSPLSLLHGLVLGTRRSVDWSDVKMEGDICDIAQKESIAMRKRRWRVRTLAKMAPARPQ